MTAAFRDRTTGRAERVRAAFAVGCDGAGSVVRDWIGESLEGLPPDEAIDFAELNYSAGFGLRFGFTRAPGASSWEGIQFNGNNNANVIGHAVRGVEETVQLATEDIRTATTLLDVRRVAGDRSLVFMTALLGGTSDSSCINSSGVRPERYRNS